MRKLSAEGKKLKSSRSNHFSYTRDPLWLEEHNPEKRNLRMH